MRGRYWHIRAVVSAILSLAAVPSLADPSTVLARWYDGLRTGDAAVASALLSDDAVLVLNDLGIEQNRAEFLESLPEWRDALEGGSIDWRLEASDAGNAVALVCYRFTGSEVEMRETFRIADERIERSEQTEAGETCAGF